MIVPAMGWAIYFGITVAEVESIVEPDGVLDDFRRKPVALVCIHGRIVCHSLLTCQYRYADSFSMAIIYGGRLL